MMDPAGAAGPAWLAALRDRVNIKCLHCGYCLTVCPSYQKTLEESHSPRGRIALLNEVSAGNLPFEEVCEFFEVCLGCRACEAVCPKGLEYGEILRGTREAMRRVAPPRGWRRAAEAILMASVRSPTARAAARWGAWFYRATGIAWLVERSGLIGKVPLQVALAHAMVPFIRAPFGRKLPARRRPIGPPKGRAALFRGCIQDAFFRQTNAATIELLAQAGYEVIVPAGQTCCGALPDHAGDPEAAAVLARRNIAAFDRSGAELIVTNSGTCGATLKEYSALLRTDLAWASRATAFQGKVRDLYELLEGEAFTPRGGLPTNTVVTYSDSCHLANVQKVREQPRALIRRIPGVRYVELEGIQFCCGFAGTFCMSHPDASLRLLEQKVKAIEASGASIVATGHPGCFLQLQAGLHRAGLPDRIRVVQLADLLWDAAQPSA